jgi:hypothetical protein
VINVSTRGMGGDERERGGKGWKDRDEVVWRLEKII